MFITIVSLTQNLIGELVFWTIMLGQLDFLPITTKRDSAINKSLKQLELLSYQLYKMWYSTLLVAAIASIITFTRGIALPQQPGIPTQVQPSVKQASVNQPNVPQVHYLSDQLSTKESIKQAIQNIRSEINILRSKPRPNYQLVYLFVNPAMAPKPNKQLEPTTMYGMQAANALIQSGMLGQGQIQGQGQGQGQPMGPYAQQPQQPYNSPQYVSTTPQPLNPSY